MDGRYESQLSEVVWKGIEHFLATRVELLTGCISSQGLVQRGTLYAKTIQNRNGALHSFIGFIDGAGIAVSCPGRYAAQQAIYNGHKRNHALKYEGFATPDGLILHAYGPMDIPGCEWTPYMKRGLERKLGCLLPIPGKQYFTYGDLARDAMSFLKVPLEGPRLDPA